MYSICMYIHCFELKWLAHSNGLTTLTSFLEEIFQEEKRHFLNFLSAQFSMEFGVMYNKGTAAYFIRYIGSNYLVLAMLLTFG